MMGINREANKAIRVSATISFTFLFCNIKTFLLTFTIIIEWDDEFSNGFCNSKTRK